MKTLKSIPGIVIKSGSDDTGDFKEYFFLIEIIPSKLKREWKAVLRVVVFVIPRRWKQALIARWGLEDE